MKRETKLLLLAVLAVLVFHSISYMYQANVRPYLLARDIVDPKEKYAFEDEREGRKYGAALLPYLVAESNDFRIVNSFNAGRIARILGNIHTPEAEAIARELYARSDIWSRLAGAHALAHHDLLDKDIPEDSFIVQALYSTTNSKKSWEGKPSDLAAETLAHFDDEHIISYFSKASQMGNTAYYACKHLSDSRNRIAIPGLFACLEDCYPLCRSVASRLLYFGEKTAVIRLIERLPSKSDPFVSTTAEDIQEFLQQVTSQDFPARNEPWVRWWVENKTTWEIPGAFQKEEFPEKELAGLVSFLLVPIGILALMVILVFGLPILVGLYVSKGISRCLPKSQLKDHDEPQVLIYAGFWPRLSAAFIDSLILLPLGLALFFAPPSRVAYAIIGVCSILVHSLYSMYFHARYGATLGKMANRIRVVTVEGEKISPWQAVYRHAIDFLLALISAAAFVVAVQALPESWLTANWQTRLLGLDTYRPKWGTWSQYACQMWVWSELIVLLLNERRRALHDFIAGTLVVFPVE
jgi:uncharacterized RDD family membrane protein YckC